MVVPYLCHRVTLARRSSWRVQLDDLALNGHTFSPFLLIPILPFLEVQIMELRTEQAN